VARIFQTDGIPEEAAEDEAVPGVSPMATGEEPGATPRSDEVADLVRRLSRIEGQIRGIKRMLQDGRDCRDLVTQFAAVSRALEQAALNYVTSELVWCVEQPEEAAAHGYSVEELRKLLGRLR
jgi:DNA-binding FrmR family transcriptional regulator